MVLDLVGANQSMLAFTITTHIVDFVVQGNLKMFKKRAIPSVSVFPG